MKQKWGHWRRLDNAAKLFSAASNKQNTRVFRFYCELKEDVRPSLLEAALERSHKDALLKTYKKGTIKVPKSKKKSYTKLFKKRGQKKIK